METLGINPSVDDPRWTPAETTTMGGNVRLNPLPESTLIAVIPRGSAMKISTIRRADLDPADAERSKNGAWYLVKLPDNKIGWVDNAKGVLVMDAVAAVEPSYPTLPPLTDSRWKPATIITGSDGVLMRGQPIVANNNIVSRQLKGTHLVAFIPGLEYGEWRGVRFAGFVGWIHTSGYRLAVPPVVEPPTPPPVPEPPPTPEPPPPETAPATPQDYIIEFRLNDVTPEFVAKLIAALKLVVRPADGGCAQPEVVLAASIRETEEMPAVTIAKAI